MAGAVMLALTKRVSLTGVGLFMGLHCAASQPVAAAWRRHCFGGGPAFGVMRVFGCLTWGIGRLWLVMQEG